MRSFRDPETNRELRKTFKWTLLLGILMMILGVFATIYPICATVEITIFIGLLLFLGGIVQLVYAFQTRSGGFFFQAVSWHFLHCWGNFATV